MSHRITQSEGQSGLPNPADFAEVSNQNGSSGTEPDVVDVGIYQIGLEELNLTNGTDLGVVRNIDDRGYVDMGLSNIQYTEVKVDENSDGVGVELVVDETERSDDPVKVYLREMGKVPLLSKDDEVKLSKKMLLGFRLGIYQYVGLSEESSGEMEGFTISSSVLSTNLSLKMNL